MLENNRRDEENELFSVDNDYENVVVGIDDTQESNTIVQGVDNELYKLHDDILIDMKLLEKYPIIAQHNNDDGCLLLHKACLSNVSENVLMKLIDLYPEAAFIKCTYKCGNNSSDTAEADLIPLYSIRGCYALHVACMSGRTQKVIQKLIQINPMALQESNDDGDYPIHYIYQLYNPNNELFRIFLDSDPLTIHHKDNDGDCALHFSSHVLWGSEYDEYHIPILEYMVQQSTNGLINTRNCMGDTPLHVACMERFDKGVETLLNHPDINPNATNVFNQTPLHYAFSTNIAFYPSPSVNIVKQLLDHPFIFIDHKDNDNKTPFDLVQEEIILLEANSDDEISPNLQEWIATKELLKEFPIRRRYHAFCFLLHHALDI